MSLLNIPNLFNEDVRNDIFEEENEDTHRVISFNFEPALLDINSLQGYDNLPFNTKKMEEKSELELYGKFMNDKKELFSNEVTIESLVNEEKVNEILNNSEELIQIIMKEIEDFDKIHNDAIDAIKLLDQEYDENLEESKNLQVQICKMRNDLLCMDDAESFNTAHEIASYLKDLTQCCVAG